MTEYKKQTDEIHEITLESQITLAEWGSKKAAVGSKVKFEVWTHFVGSGSNIEIKVQDKKGKVHETIHGQVFGDYFAGSILVPEKTKEELTFTAKLPDHGLEMKSASLPVIPPIEVSNLKWGQKEARRGDLVKMTGEVTGIPDGTEVTLYIYEYDQDGAHDRITRFPVQVKKGKIEAEWEYQYYDDTDEIPTDAEMKEHGRSYHPPEYFFVVEVFGQRFGEKQESGLLEFKDWIEIIDRQGVFEVGGTKKYILFLPDGEERRGVLSRTGYSIERDVPPGPVSIILWESP